MKAGGGPSGAGGGGRGRSSVRRASDHSAPATRGRASARSRARGRVVGRQAPDAGLGQHGRDGAEPRQPRAAPRRAAGVSAKVTSRRRAPGGRAARTRPGRGRAGRRGRRGLGGPAAATAPSRRPPSSERRRAVARRRAYDMPGRDRHAPVAPEGARRDLDAHRPLTSLVLGAIHHPDDLGDDDLGMTPAHQVVGLQPLLDVPLEDRVQHVIGRKAVRVELPGSQLGRRRPARSSPRGMTSRPSEALRQRASR